MIKFQDLSRFENYCEYKLGKKRLKYLEENLRLLGNFNSVITVTDKEYKWDSKSKIIYTYTVYDLDYTEFQFYNFTVYENFKLFMKRKNSQNTYIYDFQPYDCEKLRLAEIHCPLSEFRVFKLINYSHFFEVVIEEQEKEYCLTFDTNFEKASSCTIKRKNEIIAYLIMKNGSLIEYKIVEPNRTIHVNYLNFERVVERTMDGKDYKTEFIENPNKLQVEYNRILRKL